MLRDAVVRISTSCRLDGDEMRARDRLAVDDATQARVYLDFAARGLGPDYSHSETARFVGDLEMLHPASYLVAHAVELALNAFLQIEGIRGGRSNHDLESRLAAAKSAGLEVSERFEKYVIAMTPAHGSGQFRYARQQQHGFVSPRQAIDVVRPQVQAILDHVMRKALEQTDEQAGAGGGT